MKGKIFGSVWVFWSLELQLHKEKAFPQSKDLQSYSQICYWDIFKSVQRAPWTLKFSWPTALHYCPWSFKSFQFPFIIKPHQTSCDISIPFRKLHNLKYALAPWCIQVKSNVLWKEFKSFSINKWEKLVLDKHKNQFCAVGLLQVPRYLANTLK